MKKPNLVGVVILAGGESSRMGMPKALLPIPDFANLLAFHLYHASLLNVPILLAENGKNFAQTANYPNLFKIPDFIPTKNGKNLSKKQGNGALAAIAGAMDFLHTLLNSQTLTVQNAYILVISCDSLLEAGLVFERLITTGTATVNYFKGEKDYPLLGLYSLDIFPLLKQYLENGERAVMRFLLQVNCNAVDLPNTWRDLVNVNTMGEFTQALEILI